MSPQTDSPVPREPSLPFAAAPSLPVDVCIIGTGAAGATLALELARNGQRVLVLESGGYFPPEKGPEYLRTFLSLYADPFEHPVDGLGKVISAGATDYHTVRVRAIGGTTLRWKGNTPRLHPGDFSLQTTSGMGVDWPIRYEELEPYYVKAEHSLGVSGAGDNPNEGPRSAEYPMDAFPHSHIDQKFIPALQKLGIPFHHVPQARNFRKYQGRSECLGSATCGPYCPTGAKYNSQLYQVPEAIRLGAQVLPNVTVLRLECDGNNTGRIRRAVFVRHDPDGRVRAEEAVEAPVFVVATGGVESARLLLLSSQAGHPNGLGNNNDQVGRYFMDHPAWNSIAEIPRKVFPFRGPYQTLYTQMHYPREGREEGGCYTVQVQNWGGFKPSVLEGLAGREKWGRELREYIVENFGRQVALEIMVEQLPDSESRITLDPDKKDGFGQPLARIAWDIGDYARRGHQSANDLCAKIFEALHATNTMLAEDKDVLWGNHHSGATRMGADPAASVVDADLRVHGLHNLYICSSSTFPTIGAAHPTLTIAALAHRLADHLAG